MGIKSEEKFQIDARKDFSAVLEVTVTEWEDGFFSVMVEHDHPWFVGSRRMRVSFDPLMDDLDAKPDVEDILAAYEDAVYPG